MFTETLLRIEALSLELSSKTEKLTKRIEQAYRKNESENVEGISRLKQQELEIIGCGNRLLQFLEKNCSQEDTVSSKDVKVKESKTTADTEFVDASSTATVGENGREVGDDILLKPTNCVKSFSDSGIDVTEEEKEHALFHERDIMNDAAVLPNGLEPLETLRATLRSLKRTTDKAVVEFLKWSRHALHQDMKSQSNMERDQKLLDLISDVLTHKQEADKRMTEMELARDDGGPLSVLEKSLCYVLVDKALLNCLLLLDKAFVEGKLTGCELELQHGTVSAGQKTISEFSQAIGERKQISEMREEIERKEATIGSNRTQIRELLSDKHRLENENKSLEEKSRLWMLKSEELQMQNTVIDEERQLLKQKVSCLDESMAGLQSCTEHLRQQLQTLERQEEVRNEKDLLKEQLQNYKEEHDWQDGNAVKVNGEVSKERDTFVGEPAVMSSQFRGKAKSCSYCKLCNGNRKQEDIALLAPFKAFERHVNGIKGEELNSSLENNSMLPTIKALEYENKELQGRLKNLETGDIQLHRRTETQRQTHPLSASELNVELRVAKEHNKTLEEDLEERSTEIVLLQAQVLELEKNKSIAKQKILDLENEIRLMKGGRKEENLSHDKERRPVCVLCSKKTSQDSVDYTDNTEGIWRKDSSLPDQFLTLDGVFEEKELAIQSLKERVKLSEDRVEEMAALLGELAKRKEILVNKLEMVGAVTVIRNDFDIPDGYQEAMDGLLRSQSSLIEKGVIAMVNEAEKKDQQRKVLEEECRKLKYNAEALETENLLLQVQVSDLTQSVEELEDDVINMKCGKGGKQGKRPSTPKSTGSGGHRVTFGGDVGTKKKENESLGSLIENAKGRCVNLERQIRSNTSLVKATQLQNETLTKDREDLQRQNGHLKRYLMDFQQTNKILQIKVSELESRLKAVGEGKSLDEMEKQSLEDRLKIMEGQTKYLKERVETLQRESKSSDEGDFTATTQGQGLQTKLDVVEKETNDVFLRSAVLENEMERLKSKVKHQSAQSRILKCEVFEFLDDVRCLETELATLVDDIKPVSQQEAPVSDAAIGDTNVVSTWRDEASLCQQEGMAPIMAEILDLLRSTLHRLRSISKSTEVPLNGVDSDEIDAKDAPTNRKTLLKQQLQEETEKLRTEKRQVLREVLAMKAVFEHVLEQTNSPEAANKETEAHRNRGLTKQILSHVEKNSVLESEVLDCLKQQAILEEELRRLKENILNLKAEKDVLLSLNGSAGSHWGRSSCSKTPDKLMRDFCFVKNHGNGFEAQEVFRIESDHDNEDVFSCPSDEGVCHSPDREAGSCDSGYHDEGHSVSLSDKGETGQQGRYLSPDHTTRPSTGSYYENIGRDQRRNEMDSPVTQDKKPKGILKKRPATENEGNSASSTRKVEQITTTDMAGCKVCNFSDFFKPFKRSSQENIDCSQ